VKNTTGLSKAQFVAKAKRVIRKSNPDAVNLTIEVASHHLPVLEAGKGDGVLRWHASFTVSADGYRTKTMIAHGHKGEMSVR